MSNAQVIEEESTMSEGVNNAFIIVLNNANTKVAEDVWKDYIKRFGKTKRDRKSKEWRSESIIIPAISPTLYVNLTVRFEDLSNSSRAYAWFKMDGNYITSEMNVDEARGIKVFLEDFEVEAEKAVVQQELDDEAKTLNDLEKDLEKLIKKNEGFHKDIEKAKEEILKAENNIESNLEEQDKKREEIEAQREKMGDVQKKLNEVGKN
jgi:hypothetical protein